MAVFQKPRKLYTIRNVSGHAARPLMVGTRYFYEPILCRYYAFAFSRNAR